MTTAFASGVLQANGQMAAEPRLDVAHVVRAVLYMASLPLDANVQFMTVMATNHAVHRPRLAAALSAAGGCQGPSAHRIIGAFGRIRSVWAIRENTSDYAASQSRHRASLTSDWLSDIRRACERGSPDASS